MPTNAYFIQYKFILSPKIKHASYTYQKLFRALYGYTQNVTKSNGKTYFYHRAGVLTPYPHLRPGKNSVVVPKNALPELTNFFKTGKNPSHKWHVKGDWKAVYYVDDRSLTAQEITKAVEEQLSRLSFTTPAEEPQSLASAVQQLSETQAKERVAPYLKGVLNLAAVVVSGPWFKEATRRSPKLQAFQNNYLTLKKPA